jgi:hypothetical protein
LEQISVQEENREKLFFFFFSFPARKLNLLRAWGKGTDSAAAAAAEMVFVACASCSMEPISHNGFTHTTKRQEESAIHTPLHLLDLCVILNYSNVLLLFIVIGRS